MCQPLPRLVEVIQGCPKWLWWQEGRAACTACCGACRTYCTTCLGYTPGPFPALTHQHSRAAFPLWTEASTKVPCCGSPPCNALPPLLGLISNTCLSGSSHDCELANPLQLPTSSSSPAHGCHLSDNPKGKACAVGMGSLPLPAHPVLRNVRHQACLAQQHH